MTILTHALTSFVCHSLSYCIICMSTVLPLHGHMTAYVNKSCTGGQTTGYYPALLWPRICFLFLLLLLFLFFSYNCYLFVINFEAFSLDFIVVAVAAATATATTTGEHSM